MGRPALGLQWVEDNLGYDGDECIFWPFARNPKGYGTLLVDGKWETASRYMCRRAHGEPPTPKHQATHSCGNGHLACMTRRHLRWRTASENALEKHDHGTAQIGERCPSVRLTAEQVVEIRASEDTNPALARKYGVSASTISDARRRVTWAWL